MQHKRLLTILMIGMLSISALPVSAAETTTATDTTAALAATALQATTGTAAYAALTTVTQGKTTAPLSQIYCETLGYYLANHEWWNAITLLQAINLPAGESTKDDDMLYIATASGTLGIGRFGSRQYAHLVDDRYGYCVASYTETIEPLTSGYLDGDYNHDGKVNDTDTFLVKHHNEKRTYNGIVGFYTEMVQ